MFEKKYLCVGEAWGKDVLLLWAEKTLNLGKIDRAIHPQAKLQRNKGEYDFLQNKNQNLIIDQK